MGQLRQRRKSDAKVISDGGACEDSFDNDNDRAGNVPIPGLPPANGAPALDANELGETLGAEAEGVSCSAEGIRGHGARSAV